ncbi:MAG TPA: response regulator [Terracidiphilus sp.]|jgi:CheY-like chemotaxis protein
MNTALNAVNLIDSVYFALVVFSVLIAALAAYTAFELARRVATTRGAARGGWLCGGAIALSLGAWCIRFIGTAALVFRQTPISFSHIDPAKGAMILGLTCVGIVTACMLSFVCLSANLDRKLAFHTKRLALARERSHAGWPLDRSQPAVCEGSIGRNLVADTSHADAAVPAASVLADEHVSGPVPCASILFGVKALIVDGNHTNRRILEETLSSWGMVPVVASNAEQALALEKIASRNDQSFGLIVTDINMPRIDGFQLIERFKERVDFTAATIVMSAFGQRSVEQKRCEELGIAAHLVKPVTQSELRELVIRILRERDSQQHSAVITRAPFRETAPRHQPLTALLADR